MHQGTRLYKPKFLRKRINQKNKVPQTPTVNAPKNRPVSRIQGKKSMDQGTSLYIITFLRKRINQKNNVPQSPTVFI